MLNPVAMSIITTVYSAPAAKAKAIGVWGAVAGLGMGLGPLIGGATDRPRRLARDLLGSICRSGWRPLAGHGVVHPESRSDHPRRFDPVGQVAIAGAARLGDLRDSSKLPGRVGCRCRRWDA